MRSKCKLSQGLSLFPGTLQRGKVEGHSTYAVRKQDEVGTYQPVAEGLTEGDLRALRWAINRELEPRNLTGTIRYKGPSYLTQDTVKAMKFIAADNPESQQMMRRLAYIGLDDRHELVAMNGYAMLVQHFNTPLFDREAHIDILKMPVRKTELRWVPLLDDELLFPPKYRQVLDKPAVTTVEWMRPSAECLQGLRSAHGYITPKQKRDGNYVSITLRTDGTASFKEAHADLVVSLPGNWPKLPRDVKFNAHYFYHLMLFLETAERTVTIGLQQGEREQVTFSRGNKTALIMPII